MRALSRAWLFFLAALLFFLAGAEQPRAQEGQKGKEVPSALEETGCEPQPGFKGLDAITALVENEAAEQEEVLQRMKILGRPVPAPPALQAKEALGLMVRFLRKHLPRLKVKEVAEEFQPPLSALEGSHSLLQGRLDVVERSGEIWQQRVDLFFYRRVTVDRTGERLWAVIWQAGAIAQTAKAEDLPRTTEDTLASLLNEFACRYRKAENS